MRIDEQFGRRGGGPSFADNERISQMKQDIQQQKSIIKKQKQDIQKIDKDIQKKDKEIEGKDTLLVAAEGEINQLEDLNEIVNGQNKYLKDQNKKSAVSVSEVTSKVKAFANEVFWPNKMIDNFAPFKNVEHLTMREKANQWVEQQNIIRQDYISRLDNIQSEVDLEIENTLNYGNKILNYKKLTRATIFLIKIAILTIIIFIGWYMVKMIRER